MTVSEILALAVGQYGTRSQISEADAIRFLNIVQVEAFNANLPAFVIADQFQTITPDSRGPYSFPLSPKCRRFVGITTESFETVMGLVSYDENGTLSVPGEAETPRNIYLPIQINVFDKTYTFLFDPSADANTYRLVYYRKPEKIVTRLDDSKLLIPEEFHYSICVQGILALAGDLLTGTQLQAGETLRALIKPFWDSLTSATDGNSTAIYSEGQPGL